MNDVFMRLGLSYLKPLATAMMLPPVPFFILALIGLLAVRRHRLAPWLLAGSLAMIWLSACLGTAQILATRLLPIPSPLTSADIEDLRLYCSEAEAIVVLGSGVEPFAPEYQSSSLQYRSLERLRYGIWLGRQTGWPVGFSGGVGWGQPVSDSSNSEATIAQRIATEEFGHPLKWIESTSRDTSENAVNTVALLQAKHVKRIVLVTNAWHMARAVHNFQRASARQPIKITAAPMGLATNNELPWMRWMPSGEGLNLSRAVIREWLGSLTGA